MLQAVISGILLIQGNPCVDRDECSSSTVCRHRGYCVNTIGSFKCNCLQGWCGEHCEYKIGNETDCLDGYKGSTCHEDFDECSELSPSPCGPTEKCTNTYGSFRCTCLPGWTGHNCAIDVDECADGQSACPIWQVCINTPGSYACNCNHGWAGSNCSSDIDECLQSPCTDGGTCNNTSGSFYCSYTQGASDSKTVNVAIIAGSVTGGVLVIGAILAGVFIAKRHRKIRMATRDSGTEVGVVLK